VFVQVWVISKALDGLFYQVTVGHGVADGSDLVSHIDQDFCHAAGGLAFARACAHGADRDDWFDGFHLCLTAAHQAEIGACCQHQGGLVHHIFMRHIAVSKNHLLHILLLDQF